MQKCISCLIEQPLINFYTTKTSHYKTCKKCWLIRESKRRLSKLNPAVNGRVPYPSREYLMSLFRYEDSGVLVRNISRGNSKAGSNAGRQSADGYLRVQAGGNCLLVHRIIWKMHHGNEPRFIDHINNVRSDNRIENLQPAEFDYNVQKQLKPKNNTTGFIGVCIYKRLSKYAACLCVKGANVHLGYFEDLKSAVLTYNKAAIEHHGEAGQFKADQNIAEMKRRGWL